MIEVPPSLFGGAKVTVALVSPRTTELKVGALGGPSGVTEFELPDPLEDPAPLFATTVKE